MSRVFPPDFKCPYCEMDYELGYEYFSGGAEFAEIKCDCGETFEAHQNIRVTYSVEKKKPI